MKSDINLISLNQAEVVKEDSTVQLYRILAIVAILIVFLSSLVVFLIIQSISPEGIRKQEIALEKDISALHTKEAKIIIVNRKIKDIKKIISKRQKYDKLVSEITNVIPQKVSASNLAINDEKVNLAVSSDSLTSLNNLLNNLFDMVKNGKIIGNLNIDGISLDGASGSYTMTVSGNRI